MTRAIQGCNCCHDINSGDNRCVQSYGTGNIRGSVMIISDYPDVSETNLNKQLLICFAEKLNLNLHEFFCMNCVCCRFMNNGIVRPPNSREIKNCSVFVKYAVEIMHPLIIILMGNVALNVFKKESMTQAHGQWINAFTIPAMPIYSPYYIHDLIGKVTEIKRQELKNEMWNDFNHAIDYLKREYPNAKIFNK